MNEVQKAGDQAYRDLYKDNSKLLIMLQDLFDSVQQDSKVNVLVNEILSKSEALHVLIEGSANPHNIDALDAVLAKRLNPNDEITIIDVSEAAIEEHKKYIASTYPHKKYHVQFGDMNNIPLKEGSVDLVINDCAINYNEADTDNDKTVKEMKRVLKPKQSGILLSAVVDRTYDAKEFGNDQELIGESQVRQPGVFYPLVNDKSIKRLCWPVPYYKALITKNSLHYVEFDVEQGKLYLVEQSDISYRRFFITAD